MTSNKVENLDKMRDKIEELREEAARYGYSVKPRTPIGSLKKVVEKLRKERKGRPPCFRRAFMPIAPECAVCDLAAECAAPQDPPAKVHKDDVLKVKCDRCENGYFTVELIDETTGRTRDYGCSTEGCTNTILEQRRFIPSEDPDTPAGFGEPVVVKHGKMILTDHEMLDMIAEYIEKRGSIRTRTELYELVPATKNRVRAFVQKALAGRIIVKKLKPTRYVLSRNWIRRRKELKI